MRIFSSMVVGATLANVTTTDIMRNKNLCTLVYINLRYFEFDFMFSFVIITPSVDRDLVPFFIPLLIKICNKGHIFNFCDFISINEQSDSTFRSSLQNVTFMKIKVTFFKFSVFFKFSHFFQKSRIDPPKIDPLNLIHWRQPKGRPYRLTFFNYDPKWYKKNGSIFTLYSNFQFFYCIL